MTSKREDVKKTLTVRENTHGRKNVEADQDDDGKEYSSWIINEVK